MFGIKITFKAGFKKSTAFQDECDGYIVLTFNRQDGGLANIRMSENGLTDRRIMDGIIGVLNGVSGADTQPLQAEAEKAAP